MPRLNTQPDQEERALIGGARGQYAEENSGRTDEIYPLVKVDETDTVNSCCTICAPNLNMMKYEYDVNRKHGCTENNAAVCCNGSLLD